MTLSTQLSSSLIQHKTLESECSTERLKSVQKHYEEVKTKYNNNRHAQVKSVIFDPPE